MRARRAAITLLIFLLLGAAATLGVSWALALRGPTNAGAPERTLGHVLSERVGLATYVTIAARIGERRFSEIQVSNTVANGQTLSSHVETASGRTLGLPWQSCTEWQEFTPGGPRSSARSIGAIEMSAGGRVVRLPYRPLWPGFIANTLVYAATLAALWFIPKHLIASARRRHNRCAMPGCNYDLDGLKPGSPCPECGQVSANTKPAKRHVRELLP